MAKVWQQLPDEVRAEEHPRERLLRGVRLAQLSDPRRPWPNELHRPGSPPAIADTIARGWITAGQYYAAAKGYLTSQQAAVVADAGPDDHAVWLPMLATLPFEVQKAIVHAPPKQQMYWHLLPLAVALRDNRALDLSLAATTTPTWHVSPEDPPPASGLDWFLADEGLRWPRPTIALLESDPYLRDGAAKPSAELTPVASRKELFDFVNDTACGGYIDPVSARYRELLVSANVKCSQISLYASGLAALTTAAYATFLQAVADLDNPDSTHVMYSSRVQAAQRVAANMGGHITAVVTHLAGRRPEYSRALRLVQVEALRDGTVQGVCAVRACCGVHAGCLDDSAGQPRDCGNCGANYPERGGSPEKKKRGRDRMEACGLQLADAPTPRVAR